ncbi:integrase arm-type DNA-binding domain-containing protein [Arenimonas sp. SCN 70-307]|uniref:tyrosine-type recombinase/integrase n=1 Tax=Arenimonas sp. SCN 70-307 TaxID=1660089 RepID=UPI000AE62A52|nr:integrase arm-type DNA-binding domain-containing protein [Arenimonas sp. SCN 70-307]
MTQANTPLTDKAIKALKPGEKPYTRGLGNGLFLWVYPDGKKYWRYRFVLNSKQTLMGLGVYPDVSLADARKAHADARALVLKGVNPVEQTKAAKAAKKEAAANTFETTARDWMAANKPHWSAYYYGQVETTLKRDVFPEVGAMPIRDVRAAHLRPILKRVATRKSVPGIKRVRERGAATVAILIRQWCGAIFNYAAAEGKVDEDRNPAAVLKGLIKRPKVEHHKHLTRADLPQFIADLRALNDPEDPKLTESVKIAVELLALLWVRTAELRNAEKSEFDLEGAGGLGPVWKIPGHKMKMGQAHYVPLPERAVQLIARQMALSGNSTHLFPNQRTAGKVMSATTINRALERMGWGDRLSGHGFRGTASTVLHEANFNHAVIEKQLAHAERNKVAASYNHSEYWEDRKELMNYWQNLLLSGGSNVVPIGKAKKVA